MFTDTINKCAANAARIARLSANNPLSFWVSSMMAGPMLALASSLFSPSAIYSTLPFARW